MTWLSRRTTDPAAAPDEVLPPLSHDDADWLRAQAVSSLADVGIRSPRAEADHVVGGDGQIFGLGNLAAMLASQPRRRWRKVVDEHAAVLVSAQAADEPTSVDEIADLV